MAIHLLEEMGQARPGGGSGLLISPMGSSLPNTLWGHQTNHRQSIGTMLANGHKGTKTSVGLSLPIPLHCNDAPRRTDSKFLAQVKNPQVFVIASYRLSPNASARL
jgi:hypothetical protein